MTLIFAPFVILFLCIRHKRKIAVKLSFSVVWSTKELFSLAALFIVLAQNSEKNTFGIVYKIFLLYKSMRFSQYFHEISKAQIKFALVKIALNDTQKRKSSFLSNDFRRFSIYSQSLKMNQKEEEEEGDWERERHVLGFQVARTKR